MPSGGGSSSDSGGSGKGRQDAESQYGADSYGSYDSSQNTSDRDDNNNSNIVDEVALTGGSTTSTSTSNNNNNNNNNQFDYESEAYNTKSNAFDYETEAYKGDVNIDAGYGPGKITSAPYDAKTGKTNIEQTVGIIDTDTYQTDTIQEYLD